MPSSMSQIDGLPPYVLDGAFVGDADSKLNTKDHQSHHRPRSKLAKRPQSRRSHEKDEWKDNFVVDDDGIAHDPEYVGFRTVPTKQQTTSRKRGLSSASASSSSDSYRGPSSHNQHYQHQYHYNHASSSSPTIQESRYRPYSSSPLLPEDHTQHQDHHTSTQGPRRTSEDFARPVVNTSTYASSQAAAIARKASERKARQANVPSTIQSSGSRRRKNQDYDHWAPPPVPDFLQSTYVPSRVGLAVNPSSNWGADVIDNPAYESAPYGASTGSRQGRRHREDIEDDDDDGMLDSGCSSIGRKWRAFKLDLRFGAFRFGRRVKRKLNN